MFKLADLAKKEQSCLQRHDCDTMAHVNSSRLKEGLVFQIPGLQAYKQRHDVYLPAVLISDLYCIKHMKKTVTKTPGTMPDGRNCPKRFAYL